MIRNQLFLKLPAVGLTALIAIAFAQTDAANPPPANLVLQNGFVYTVDAARSSTEAIAVRAGEIVYVGTDEGAKRFVGPQSKIIDLKGRMVMPGLVDGHVHPLGGGQVLNAFSLEFLPLSVSQIRARLVSFLAQSKTDEPNGWLQIVSWDLQSMVPAGTVPDQSMFAGLSSKRPIILQSTDGHNALVNTRTLELAKITARTKNPPGGEIVRDARGQPTGLLKDEAIGLVAALIPAPTMERKLTDLKTALKLLNAQGVTSLLDAAGGEETARLYRTLLDRNQLNARVENAIVVNDTDIQNPVKALEKFNAIRQRWEKSLLRVHTAKFFLDGVIEFPAQTAAMIEPYLLCGDEANCKPSKNFGNLYFKPQALNKAFMVLDAAGWQLHLHAIGDRAIRAGLDGLSAARRANGKLDHRHAITHLELVDPKDVPRFAQLDVIASMQLQWAQRDSYTVESLESYLGPQRMKNIYPARSLQDAGARLAGGSDWPVDPLNQWRQIEQAVTRTAPAGLDGTHSGALLPEQRITLEDSLAMHTINSAYQLKLDQQTGSLEVGKRADLIVLDQNLFKVPLTKISKTKVMLTVFNGQVIHRGE
jgi:predicted amidohydrolase YtcJ